MISYESDDVSSDVKPPWTFQTYLGNLPPTATRMSAPCVSAWRPPWAHSCWPQAPRANASWLWILFHVASKKYLMFDSFVAVSRLNLSQANVRSLFDFATCIGLSNCFNGKCCVTWMEVGSRCRGLWLMSCEATCWMFAWYTLLHYVIILHMKHACIRFDRTCSRTV